MLIKPANHDGKIRAGRAGHLQTWSLEGTVIGFGMRHPEGGRGRVFGV